jgi:hypothetical protein
MAKTQKYSEDLLLEAVIKYSDEYYGTIKYTELAEWARNNIPGLEDVRDFNFSRPIKTRNPKNGKIVEKTKECTRRIEEINKARNIYSALNTNKLLYSSNIDEFLKVSPNEQKKLIVEVREKVHELSAKNRYLLSMNDAYKRINNDQKEKINELDTKTKEIIKKQKKIEKRLNYILKTTDEENRKEMLSQMGIEDESIDLVKYNKSINEDIIEMFDIGKTLEKYHKKEKSSPEELMEWALSGIDFGDEE